MDCVFYIWHSCKLKLCKILLITEDWCDFFFNFCQKNSTTKTTEYVLILHTSNLKSNGGSIMVPKSAICVYSTHLIVIDPSNELITNVTPNCFQITEVLRFLGKFDYSVSRFEDNLLKEAKKNGIIGKFRDYDVLLLERINNEWIKKSSWVLGLFGFKNQS